MGNTQHRVTSDEYKRYRFLRMIVPERVFKSHGITVSRGKIGDGAVTVAVGPRVPARRAPGCKFTLDQGGEVSPMKCMGFRWPSEVRYHSVDPDEASKMIAAFFGKGELMIRAKPLVVVGDPAPWAFITIERQRPAVDEPLGRDAAENNR